jgi:hypothetical protein
METSAIASLATDMSNARVQQAVEISVLKKAIDIQAQGALQLLQAMPPLPTLSSSGGMAGQLVNVIV